MSKKIWIIVGIIIVGALIYLGFFGALPIAKKEPKKIGLPLIVTPVQDDIVKGLKAEMEQLGYKENIDVIYDRKNIARGPNAVKEAITAVQEMFQNDYDLLVVSREEVKIALEETERTGKKIPIVFTEGDTTIRPLIQGFITSGKNVTGIFVPLDEATARQLDILKRWFPQARIVGYFGQGFMVPAPSPAPVVRKALIDSASKLGLNLKEYTTTVKPGPALEEEQKRILNAIKPGEVDAWIHIPAHFVEKQQIHEGALGKRLKIPVIMPGFSEIARGVDGLFSFSADYENIGRQAATMIDKILRGTTPSDIPIEFPRKVFLGINKETVDAINTRIPDEILQITDRFVE